MTNALNSAMWAVSDKATRQVKAFFQLKYEAQAYGESYPNPEATLELTRTSLSLCVSGKDRLFLPGTTLPFTDLDVGAQWMQVRTLGEARDLDAIRVLVAPLSRGAILELIEACEEYWHARHAEEPYERAEPLWLEELAGTLEEMDVAKLPCPTCGKAVHPVLGWEWAGAFYCDDSCAMVAHDAYAEGLREHCESEAAARWDSPNLAV